MQCLRSCSLQHGFISSSTAYLRSLRNASLTSAISRGIRKGSRTIDRLGTTRRNVDEDDKPQTKRATPPTSRFDLERPERSARSADNRWRREREAQSNISDQAPQGVPYTTAGSEFIYGTFAVKAALEAKRRQIHKLYVWRGEGVAGDQHDESIYRLAKSKRVKTQEVSGSWDKMLARMSGQRPHNGYVLEASPVPKLPVISLGQMEGPQSSLNVSVPPQSAEDQSTNNTFQVEDSTATIPRNQGLHRFPLLLWLDRVTDTGNLGAIVRSAYFFGVDAILTPEHGTAPFSPITIKASAGTAEHMPILTVKKETDFLKISQQKGWKFFAAVAPESHSTRRGTGGQSEAIEVSTILDTSPCVLMVGNEGEGLRTFLQKAADKPVSIHGVRGKHSVVDSLNVSVAAALLMARFLEPNRGTSSGSMEPTESAEQTQPASRIKSNEIF